MFVFEGISDIDRCVPLRLTGNGRCSLRAAIVSPGASKATVGAPNVKPISEARAPPRECPVRKFEKALRGR